MRLCLQPSLVWGGCNVGPVLITGRNEVLAKVIFSQACVILFTGGVSGPGGVPPIFRGSPIFRGGGVSTGFSPEYGQRSAGTHPTGMHSCFIL